VTLAEKYLNVRQRKLGITVYYHSDCQCLRGIFAWPTQIPFVKPSPAVVPLQLCTNRGGLYNTYKKKSFPLKHGKRHFAIIILLQLHIVEGLTPGSFTLESAQSSVPPWIQTKYLLIRNRGSKQRAG
jgi:hypothetical protein